MSNQPGVWSGVKIGCGMFIVLPLILIGVFLLVMTPTCSAIKSQKKAVEKLKQEKSESIRKQ